MISKILTFLFIRCEYTDEEKAKLVAVMDGIAKYECFKKFMEYSCKEHVGSLIKDLAGNQ